jgi:hypothetical protein
MTIQTAPVVIDITMPELHKRIKNWQVRNPGVTDPHQAMLCAINESWPGADVHQVLFQAEANWIRQDRLDMIRDKNKNLKNWVDTTVQGDMFNDLPISVPEHIIDDQGEAVEYWKCSLPNILKYVETRILSLTTEEKALRDAADVKRAEIEKAKANADKMRTAIARAVEAGIDPTTLSYAKAR